MFLSTCVILSLRLCLVKWHFSPHRKHVILILSGALVTTGFTHASHFSLTKRSLLEWPTFTQQPHLGKFLLCPPRRRIWSDVSQMLFDQGVDPASLFRRGEEWETAIRCNFHGRQMIVFKLLVPELFFLILEHPVYKMWIIHEPNMLELWNKPHFEEEKTESIYHV